MYGPIEYRVFVEIEEARTLNFSPLRCSNEVAPIVRKTLKVSSGKLSFLFKLSVLSSDQSFFPKILKSLLTDILRNFARINFRIFHDDLGNLRNEFSRISVKIAKKAKFSSRDSFLQPIHIYCSPLRVGGCH